MLAPRAPRSSPSNAARRCAAGAQQRSQRAPSPFRPRCRTARAASVSTVSTRIAPEFGNRTARRRVEPSDPRRRITAPLPWGAWSSGAARTPLNANRALARWRSLMVGVSPAERSSRRARSSAEHRRRAHRSSRESARRSRTRARVPRAESLRAAPHGACDASANLPLASRHPFCYRCACPMSVERVMPTHVVHSALAMLAAAPANASRRRRCARVP